MRPWFFQSAALTRMRLLPLLLALVTVTGVANVTAAEDYLPKVGPPSLRFELPPGPGGPRYVLPPLENPLASASPSPNTNTNTNAIAAPEPSAPTLANE